MAEFDVRGDSVKVSGNLEEQAEPQMRSTFRRLLDSGGELVTVDLSEVDTIASACIGSLVALWVELSSAGRRLRLFVSPQVMKVLEMTGLTSALRPERSE